MLSMKKNQLFKIQLKKDQEMRLMYETTHNKLRNENEQLKKQNKELQVEIDNRRKRKVKPDNKVDYVGLSKDDIAKKGVS